MNTKKGIILLSFIAVIIIVCALIMDTFIGLTPRRPLLYIPFIIAISIPLRFLHKELKKDMEDKEAE